MSLLVFSLVLSIAERGAWKFSTIMVILLISPFSCLFFFFFTLHCETLLLVHIHLELLGLLGGLSLLLFLSVCGNFLCSEVYHIHF